MGVEIVANGEEIESISVPAVWLVPAVVIGIAALYLLLMLGKSKNRN